MRSPAALARAEWGPLWSTVHRGLVAERWRVAPMTLGAVCLTALFQYVQNQSWGYRFVEDVGSVRAEDPLWLSALRTPLSLFVPALDLPVWGALAQVLIVFGIAEICLGWRGTLAVGYVATLAGTLYARLGITLGPDGPLGLPASDAQLVDNGPSAAVVGLAVYVCWCHRAWRTAGVVVAVMAIEAAMKPNLAGREHLAAMAAVAVVAVARWAFGAVRHRDAERSESGVPPIRS
ncbi:hypothetical protein [Streptomyces sp. NPDC059262]|uniref:hypothetical protein n=1 Tax=Streptomyces sp. NPDC059262 TaxID=3346797 RepID=UPI003677DAB9